MRLRFLFPKFLFDWYHRVSAVVSDWWWGHPSRKLLVIGVTGTNGKTTVSHFIAEILKTAGKSTGLISTIAIRVGGEERVNETKMTSLKNCWQIQKLLRAMVNAGDTHVVIETTSHALDQYRVHRIWYDCAVLTNVSREHLDYHITLEEYRKAKERLFQIVATRKKKVVGGTNVPRVSVVNSDDASASHFLRYRTDRRCGFGRGERPAETTEECFVKPENIVRDASGVSFQVQGEQFRLSTHGVCLVENACAAITAVQAFGISLATSASALRTVRGIPGRLECIDEGQPFAVVIDYAVTPDAFEKLADVIRGEILASSGKWWWVFGATGERDRGKRPILGAIASEKADYCVLTNEDPFHEDPERILDEVEVGIKKAGGVREQTYWRILDRKEAIQFALRHAQKGDCVTITGKGAETAMAIGDERLPWNEREIVRDLLRDLKKYRRTIY